MKSEMKRWTDENVFWVGTCIKWNLVLSEISEMKRWRVRWRDEEIFFLVWTCIKPNLVLSEISEMKSEDEMRWTDKENFFGSEHVSSQIWCYLKLVRWRDEEWDEEMNRWRKFFFRTCIKPNLVLSEISEMKRWRVRWRDEQMKKIFLGQTCIKPNLVLSEISEMKRWRVRWRDEQKKILGSEHVSSQIWCYLKLVRWRDEEWDEMNRWRKIFFGLNMYQAKSGVIWN